MLRKFDLDDKEKELITRMAVLQMAVHRHLCQNIPNYSKIKFSDGHIMELLTPGKNTNNVTLEHACINLLKSYKKCARPSFIDEYLVEKIDSLILDVANSDLKDLKIFTYTKGHKESELSDFYLLTFFDLKRTSSIAFASEKLGIPASTIKNACQDRRLKNTEKEGKYWRVYLGECARLWNVDIERHLLLMPYMD